MKRFVYYDRDIARPTEQSRCEQENVLSLKNYTSIPEIVLTEIDMFTTNEHTLKDNNILYSLKFSRGIYFMVLSISAKKTIFTEKLSWSSLPASHCSCYQEYIIKRERRVSHM